MKLPDQTSLHITTVNNIIILQQFRAPTSENSMLNVIRGEGIAANVVGNGSEEMLHLEDRVWQLCLLHQSMNS